jgi:uncharacterized protein YcbX
MTLTPKTIFLKVSDRPNTMNPLILSEIWIYPIKSLGGVQLDKAEVLRKGLQWDRRWMLVDDHSVFLTQREHPQMALFKLTIRENRITITFRRNKTDVTASTSFIVTVTRGKELRAKIWNDEVTVIEVDPGISEWFSHHLGIICKLVAFPEENPRLVDERYNINTDHVSLADGYPFMIIGQSSLDDLNTRLTEPLPMNRFRPNFVFTGGSAYEEDRWKKVFIGDNAFVAVKKCARCPIPTVDQDTAEKGQDPLRTLALYRNEGHNIYFGQNLVVLQEGIVAAGDLLLPEK